MSSRIPYDVLRLFERTKAQLTKEEFKPVIGLNISSNDPRRVLYPRIEEYQFCDLNPEEPRIIAVTLFLRERGMKCDHGLEYGDKRRRSRCYLQVGYKSIGQNGESQFYGCFSRRGNPLNESAEKILNMQNMHFRSDIPVSLQELIDYLMTTVDKTWRTNRRFRGAIKTAASLSQEVYERVLQAFIDGGIRLRPDLPSGEVRYNALRQFAFLSALADHEDKTVEDETTGIGGVFSECPPTEFYLHPEMTGPTMHAFIKVAKLTGEEVYRIYLRNNSMP